MLLSLLRWHWVQNIEQKKTTKNQRNKNMKKQNTERQKALPKELLENADLHKPVRNKIITTCE